jgi:hypothetical protein
MTLAPLAANEARARPRLRIGPMRTQNCVRCDHLPWSLTSDKGRAPGRALDTLPPIPDAEYPSTQLVFKASCV